MFTVYGVSGPLFTGSGEQLRDIVPVPASARLRAIAGNRHPDAQHAVAANLAERAPARQRPPIAAYAQHQQDGSGRQPALRVSDLMSAGVISVPLAASAAQAWNWLARHAVAQAPVVDAGGRLVGLLLRNDLMPAWHAADTVPALDARTVAELMCTPVPSVAPDTDIRRVAQVLLDTGLPGLPVVDAQALLTGFISRSDLLRALTIEPPLDLWT